MDSMKEPVELQLSPSGMETCPPNISDAISGSESLSQTITAASKNHSRLGTTPTSPKKEKDTQVTKDSPLSVWITMSKYKKYVSLLVLIFQNTALVLTMRYSRTGEGPKYLASTAVVLTELLKFTICFGMVFYEHDSHLAKTIGVLKTEIVGNFAETIKLSIPAVLYTIQNNLLYLALSHLDAATFQVTYQLKILTTALFSVFLLNKKLNRIKWCSLIVLTFAVGLVQLPSGSDDQRHVGNTVFTSMIGVGAVLLACLSSGFSGVFIEKILKESDTSMWIRNIQLSLLSFGVGLFGVLVSDFSAVMERGFFQGYSTTVGIVICLQAAGGLLVAVVMKYADNILKGFATAISIVLSSIFSYFLADFHPSVLFLIGAFLVLVATFMYSKQHNVAVLPTQTDPKGS